VIAATTTLAYGQTRAVRVDKRPADPRDMSIGAVNGALDGLATAQALFGAATQAGAQGDASAGRAASAAQAAEEASIAVLRMALSNERSMVNIVA
jgi:hypothetical protein